MAQIHGGQIIARALRRECVDPIFTLTSGHIVPILDGCAQEGIRIVDVRHEQSAAHAADAFTRLTGRLGVAAVTAGPGVTDTITAVATALYSSVLSGTTEFGTTSRLFIAWPTMRMSSNYSQ